MMNAQATPSRVCVLVMGLLLLAGSTGAEILLSPGDIGPSDPATMVYERQGLLLTRPGAWVFSGGAIPYPQELEGVSSIDVTLYFIPDSDAAGDVDFTVLVDSYDSGDPYNVGGFEGHAAPVPVGGSTNIVYSQDFSISFAQFGTDMFRVAMQRNFYGSATDTYQTGVYLHAIKIRATGGSAVQPPIIPPQTSLFVSPNPFQSQLNVRYGLPESSTVSLMIFDAEGRLIEELDRGHQSPGSYSLSWELGDSARGIYFVRLLLDGVESNAKVVKIR